MAIQSPLVPEPDLLPSAGGSSSSVCCPSRLAFWVLACVLLAWVQIGWAGYQLGAGQAIQVPFLEALHNPLLFHRDIMVQTTLGPYPSCFMRSRNCRGLEDVPAPYLALHVLTTAGVFLAAWWV